MDMKIEVDGIRVCIAGFSQDKDFVRQFTNLHARKDGFLDRLLFAVPSLQLLMNKEVDSWVRKLSNYPINDLTYVYQRVWEAHMSIDSTCKYTLSQEAYRE